jgi:Ras-related protein Rab-6A
MIIVIVGNKADLTEQRQVSMEQGNAKANDKKCLYHETSALSGLGVEDLFSRLVE